MRLTPFLAALALTAAPAAADAALRVGDKAPDFHTLGALAGNKFNFHLSHELRNGPMVLYFFPKAFTEGCTLETREFAEQIGEFKKAGAAVVGMSGDTIEKLAEFSVKECSGKFPVAAATAAIVDGYDVRLNKDLTNRTSYVIAPNGRVIYAHSEMDYRKHVANTLAAVRDWKAKNP